MKRTFGVAVAAAVALAAGAGGGVAQVTEIGAGEGELNIVAWPGYIERGETDKAFDWVTKFEEATGCKVNVKTANTSDEMVALMNEGGFDLVTASGDASLRLVAGKRVQPINTDLIPSWSKIDDRLKDAPWFTVDGAHYGVPYQWGPNVLMYNTEVFKEAPKSWSVVFEEQTLPDGQSNKGRVQAYDGPIHIADAAQYLMAHKPELGITNPYELDEDQYKAALDLLRQQRQLVGRYWHDAMIQIDDFKNEGVVASGSWPFQVNLLKSEGAPIASTIPEEGATGWADTTMLRGRRRAPELRLPLDGAHAQPRTCRATSRSGSARMPVVPAACEDGSGQQTKEGCAANGFEDFDRIRFWTHAGLQVRAGRVRALLPLGVGLHRRDRRPLTRLAMAAAVEFEGVVASLRRRARRRRRRPRDRRGLVLRHARAVGLGQDHLPAPDLGLRDRRPPATSASSARRPSTCRPTGAASTPSSRTMRSSPTSTCATTSPTARWCKGVPQARAPRRGRGDAGARPPRRLRRPQAVAALGRPAPAGGARAGAGQPPARPAPRRAARRARPQAPRGDAGRAQGAAVPARHHLRLRHPRPGRGAVDGRPGGGLQRRPDRPGRHAAGDLRPAADPLRRRLRRLGQRAAAGARGPLRRRAAGRACGRRRCASPAPTRAVAGHRRLHALPRRRAPASRSTSAAREIALVAPAGTRGSRRPARRVGLAWAPRARCNPLEDAP